MEIRFWEIPFFKFGLWWAIGILIAYYTQVSAPFLLTLTAVSFLALLVFTAFKSRLGALSYFVLSACGILFLLSISGYNLKTTIVKTNLLSSLSKYEYAIVRVLKNKKNTTNFYCYSSEIIELVDSSNTTTKYRSKILVYTKSNVQTGDVLLIPSVKIKPISRAKNPLEFNYSEFLELNGIKGQCFLYENPMLLSKNNKFHFWGKVDAIRNDCIAKFNNIHPDERAIAQALTLGFKENISSSIKQQYADTGIMHILAVSGLHVGIVFILISALLSVIIKHNRFRLLRMVIILVTIWSYALLSGLPPSVLRASLMFSVIAVGKNLNTSNSTYNNVMLSALVLLFFNPLLLFNVSFQLSYAAVFSIITFQPAIYRLLKSKYWPLNRIWAIISVSIAAQIGTMPFALFYFHQFPTYFFLTNIVAIPAAFLIVTLGIIHLLSQFLTPDFSWITAFLLELPIKAVNITVAQISSWPLNAIKHVHITLLQAISLVIASFFTSYGIIFRKLKIVSIGLISLSLFLYVGMQNSVERKKAELIVFSTKHHVTLGLFSNGLGTMFSTDSSFHVSSKFNVSPYYSYKAFDTLPKALPIKSQFYTDKWNYCYPLISINDKIIQIIDTDYTLVTANKYIILNRPNSKYLQNIKPEHCIFIKQADYKWFLQEHPTFEKAHCIEKDGALKIE